MRARRLSLIALAALGVLFLSPPQARADSHFPIYNLKGHRVGAISSSDHINWTVANVRGTQVGCMQEGTHPAASVYHTPAIWDRDLAWAYLGVLHPSAEGSSPDALIGRAVRSGKRWLLERRVGAHYRKLGWAPRSCPIYDALAAARLLLWPHRNSPYGSWTVTFVGGSYAGSIWSDEEATYGGSDGSSVGSGATFWNGTDLSATYCGEVCHEMTERGPVANMWASFDLNWTQELVEITRESNNLFTVTDLESGSVVEQAIRSTSGPWQLQAPSDGGWLTMATVSRSCPGAWAMGSELLLPMGN